MKLLSHGPRGQERPGILDRDGRVRDLSGRVADIGPDALSPASLDRLRDVDPASLPAVPSGTRLGPWLVTKDEVPDPQGIEPSCEVSGDVMQSGTTRSMIFSRAQLVSYISRFMTLLPGDVSPTGTPAGVGYGRERFLRPGDTMRLRAAGLGERRQRVVAYG